MLALDATPPRHLRIAAKGVLRVRDYQDFEPRFAAELARRPRPVPLLLDLTGFRGWTVGGLLSDIRFDLRYRRAFSRIAVTGDRRWHKWLSYAAVPIFAGKLRFFAGEGRARAWLGE